MHLPKLAVAHMDFVDKCDPMISQHGMVHKWTMNCVSHLIKETIHNLYILYVKILVVKPLSFIDFKVTFVKEIFDDISMREQSSLPSQISEHKKKSHRHHCNKPASAKKRDKNATRTHSTLAFVLTLASKIV